MIKFTKSVVGVALIFFGLSIAKSSFAQPISNHLPNAVVSFIEPIECGFQQDGMSWKVYRYTPFAKYIARTSFRKKKIGGNNLWASAYFAYQEGLKDDMSLEIKLVTYRSKKTLRFDQSDHMLEGDSASQQVEEKTIIPGGWIAVQLVADDGKGRSHLQRELVYYPTGAEKGEVCEGVISFWKKHAEKLEGSSLD